MRYDGGLIYCSSGGGVEKWLDYLYVWKGVSIRFIYGLDMEYKKVRSYR